MEVVVKVLAPLMMAMGIGHALIGILLFRDTFLAILQNGVLNTIGPPFYVADPHFDRIAFFWFLMFSPVLFMLGQITSRSIAGGASDILSVVGWNLLGIGIVGTAVLPISGNSTLIILGALVLKAASRVGE